MTRGGIIIGVQGMSLMSMGWDVFPKSPWTVYGETGHVYLIEIQTKILNINSNYSTMHISINYQINDN